MDLRKNRGRGLDFEKKGAIVIGDMMFLLGVSWFRLDELSVDGMSRMIVGLVKLRSKL